MEDKIMKKLLAIFLAILCLLTMLSIPALAADAGVEPYGTPGSGYDSNLTVGRIRHTSICSLTLHIEREANVRQRLW